MKHAGLDVDGLRIHCLVAGESGPALVLLHGGGTDSASLSWSEVLGPLSAHHRVFAPHWPGFGQSDKPAISYTMDYYVHFLQHLLSALDLSQAVLIGLSMGGGIALNFTLNDPARVKKLVLVDPYYGFKSSADKWWYLYLRLPFVMDLPILLGRNRTLVQWGLSNVLHHPERRTQALIAHSQLAILPGCGHWVQRDDPRAFLQAVEPFLET